VRHAARACGVFVFSSVCMCIRCGRVFVVAVRSAPASAALMMLLVKMMTRDDAAMLLVCGVHSSAGLIVSAARWVVGERTPPQREATRNPSLLANESAVQELP
jgi:hypothetical protein